MQCTFCSKTFTNNVKLKRHQTTAKFCIVLQNGQIESKLFQCSFCSKKLTSLHSLNYHKNICKKAKEEKKIQEEQMIHQTVQKHQKRVDWELMERKRDVEDIECKIDGVSSQLLQKQEDIDYRLQDFALQIKKQQEEYDHQLRIKEEKQKEFEKEQLIRIEQMEEDQFTRIKQLEEELKRLKENQLVVRPTSTSNSIQSHSNNTNTTTTISDSMNNNTFHISITNYLTEERVTKAFESYDVKTLMGSQKELANFTIDNFLLGKNTPTYICTDRSRKKFFFSDESGKMVEDVNCDILVSYVIKYGFAKISQICIETLENIPKGITSDMITKKYESIRDVKKNGTEYKSQLGKRLPSTVDEKSKMDDTHVITELPPIPSIEEEVEVIEQLTEEEKSYREKFFAYLYCYHIGKIPLYKLNEYRTKYRETGDETIPNIVLRESQTYPDVIKQFGQFIRSSNDDRTIYNPDDITYIEF